MDKRWIGILIIFIVGMVCMYYIVEDSPSVGNAMTVINDVSVSMPLGYNILDSSADTVTLLSKNNESIFVNCTSGNPDKLFKKEITSFQDSNNVELKNDLSNETLKYAQFEDLTSGKNTSFACFEKEGHTFLMKMENFNDMNQEKKDMMFVIDNIIHDFKQNK